jgi:pyridoxamine 5'-phosphate oxidase
MAGVDEASPLARVQAWCEDAVAAGLPEPDAMALATADAAGRPSVRFVLLKGVDDRGVRFFTNYESRKGRELGENARAAAALYWNPLGRQVRLEGMVERLEEEESDAYWATRGRGSRIGAWASRQSSALAGRELLDARVEEVVARFEGADIPRPAYWGGFLLRPDVVEFWTGRPDRLHDREEWRLAGGAWSARRLSP